MIIVYGIKNCDSVKKALKWLAENNIPHQLHDFRVNGVTANWLSQAETAFGWQALLNKRSTSWRNLDDELKNNLSKDNALAILLANPTLIKRPIILQDGTALIGFDQEKYQRAFAKD